MSATRTHQSPTEISWRFLCACLRDEKPRWPRPDDDDNFTTELLASSAYHGVQVLLYHKLYAAPPWHSWPLKLRDELARITHHQTALELARKNELQRIIKTLSDTGMQTLLLKGTALAYSLYLTPSMRTRIDTDLLIRHRDKAHVHQALLAHGYQRANTTTGELVSYQDAYYRQDEFTVNHALDLHWQINNTQLFAHSFGFAELLDQAQPLPRLGPAALGLTRVHSLLLACIHRIGHFHAPYYSEGNSYYGGDRLIWLYDIHLLCQELAPQSWAAFVQLAIEKQLCGVCLHGLRATQTALTTPIPEHILEQLITAERSEKISVDKLVNGHWRYRLAELKTLSGQKRLQLVKEHLLPPKEYMLKKYHTERQYLLPLLYLHRALAGCFKRLT